MCFMGYPPGMKGYKLFDINNKEIFVSRDVIFHESVFPFHLIPSSESTINPFPTVVLPKPATTLDIAPTFTEDSMVVSPTLEVHADRQNHYPILSPSTQPTSVRLSTTVSRQPSYLRDYHCHLLKYNSAPSTSILYPINNYMSYDTLSSSHKKFVLNVSSQFEPQFFHQAIKIPTWKKKDELDAMELNNTWSIVPLPSDKQSIGCRWVYKVKYASDGSIDRHKARLVAKGYTQQEGVDFFETFSPVAKLATVKILLALAASQQWHLAQLDINNAFLNGDLLEEVYMDLPPGYQQMATKVINSQKLVCHLHKSIYGLRQASRQWYTKFSLALLEFGFIQSQSDYTLFTKGSGSLFLALLVYVDDIIIAGPSNILIQDLISELQNKFKLKDLGNLKYFSVLKLRDRHREYYYPKEIML